MLPPSLSSLSARCSTTIAVIGGGPSGYFGAIAAARHLRNYLSFGHFETDGDGDVLQRHNKNNNKTDRRINVVLLESTFRPLQKVLDSGGGRCNVMHTTMPAARDLAEGYYPRGRREMIGPFTVFDQKQTRDWFVMEGVDLKTEPDGRVFPVTDDSKTIANALKNAADREGIHIITGATVKSIKKTPPVAVAAAAAERGYSSETTKEQQQQKQHRFELLCASKGNKTHQICSSSEKQSAMPFTVCCDAILLATGSAPAGYRLSKSLGQPMTKPYPSLFSFRLCEGHALENLQGVSLPNIELTLLPNSRQFTSDDDDNDDDDKTKKGGKKKKIAKRRNSIKDFTQSGPLLITHRGVSGPAALRLSSFAAQELKLQNYTGTLALNLIPGSLGQNQVASILRQFSLLNGKKMLSTPLSSSAATMLNPRTTTTTIRIPQLPRRLWKSILSYCAIDSSLRWSQLSRHQVGKLSEALTALPLRFKGKDTNKEEFVTAGGVQLDGVYLKRMESKFVPGLFFAGEVLNVDGVTGGFNFQNCWSTGYIAGVAMADSVLASEL